MDRLRAECVIVKEKSKFRGYKGQKYDKGVCWVKLSSAAVSLAKDR